jgi:hypothetical protein
LEDKHDDLKDEIEQQPASPYSSSMADEKPPHY